MRHTVERNLLSIKASSSSSSELVDLIIKMVRNEKASMQEQHADILPEIVEAALSSFHLGKTSLVEAALPVATWINTLQTM